MRFYLFLQFLKEEKDNLLFVSGGRHTPRVCVPSGEFSPACRAWGRRAGIEYIGVEDIGVKETVRLGRLNQQSSRINIQPVEQSCCTVFQDNSIGINWKFKVAAPVKQSNRAVGVGHGQNPV